MLLCVSHQMYQEKHISCCWEFCKAICMYSMIINHLRAHQSFASCALKCYHNSRKTQWTFSSHLKHGVESLECFPIPLDKNRTLFHSTFKHHTYSDVIKVITALKLKGELSSNYLIQHSHFVKET